MKESKFRIAICDIIKGLGGHASKVESPDLSAGIPDIDYCLNTVENHIELKVGDTKNWPHIRPTQCLWFNRRTQAGASPFILFLDNDTKTIYAIAGACVDKIANKNPAFWAEHAFAKFGFPIDPEAVKILLLHRVSAPWPWPSEPEAGEDD